MQVAVVSEMSTIPKGLALSAPLTLAPGSALELASLPVSFVLAILPMLISSAVVLPTAAQSHFLPVRWLTLV